MKKGTYPTAVVREENGQIILDDPAALAVIKAVNKSNCQNLFNLNAERVAYFKQRLSELGRSAADTVIVLINVDDVNGGPIARLLMPGFDWQPIRDRGETPIARGLASREAMEGILISFDSEASEKLKNMTEVAVVVVDEMVAEIFPA